MTLKAICTEIEVDERDVKRIINQHFVTINRAFPEESIDVIEKLQEGDEAIPHVPLLDRRKLQDLLQGKYEKLE